jgi:glycosyltransferase involved in cell wall biosynthesis
LRGNVALEEGINLHGLFLSETGLGESARLLFRAISTQVPKIAACNRILKDRQNETSFRDIVSDSAPYNVGITIDGLTGFKGLRYQICKRKYNIAYPFWELDSIPQKYIDYLEQYDAVWAPSSFILETLKRYSFSNLELLKHPVDLPSEEPKFLDPERTLKILFYFDFDSFPARKNPESAIFAFKQAFPKGEDVSLTIKTRGKRDVGRRHWLAQEAAGDPRITIVDRLLDRDAVNAMMAEHDVFLSLHRSEGLGLGCAEALAAGKAVVATDYGGSTEFINARTGFPVEWTRTEVGPEEYVLTANTTWAEPSVDHAARLLRSIYEDPASARDRARNGFRHLVENHSFSAVGRNVLHLLRRKGPTTACIKLLRDH